MKAYIYCTKAKPFLWKQIKGVFSEELDWFYKVTNDEPKGFLAPTVLNGKIVACFDLNTVEKINFLYVGFWGDVLRTKTLEPNVLEEKSCLSNIKLADYIGRHSFDNNNRGYAWHIDNLQVYDKPLELSDFGLKKAPQSWCYGVDDNGGKCIVISIKPQWVEKILNGSKTIEVRKTCPKEFKE